MESSITCLKIDIYDYKHSPLLIYLQFIFWWKNYKNIFSCNSVNKSLDLQAGNYITDKPSTNCKAG